MAGTQYGIPPNNINSLSYLGSSIAFTPVTEAARDPVSTDVNYPIDCFWRNNVSNALWFLSGFDSTGALWIPISSGPTPSLLTFLGGTGTTGFPVTPSVTGDLTLTSSAGTLTITGSTNAINFDLTGGTEAIDSIGVDAFTGPGTNPVLPTAAGLVTVTGAQVAAGAVGTNVIRTDSLAANTYTIQVQRSTTASSSTVADNGVCHFNSGQFTVDSNGFVSSIGMGLTWQLITADQTLEVNHGYICVSPGTNISLTLPTTSAVGDIIEITIANATSWTVRQASGQNIRMGTSTTTVGTTGGLSSTALGDTIRMVCRTANTTWIVLSSMGNITVA